MARYITELFFDGSWNDITPDVRDSAPIVLSRGRRDWATETDPATCTLTLNNGPSKAAAGVQGRYSPRNPRSDLFGKIGRNTPIRIREDVEPVRFATLPGMSGSYVTTPDVTALDIVGDIDVRIEIDPATWRPDGGAGLARKYLTTGDQRSWAFYLNESGTLSFRWTTGGTSGTIITTESTVAVPETSGRLAVRVALDVNNGAAGNTVTFSTSDSIDGTYTTLGAAVVTPGVTSVFSSTADLEVGRTHSTDLPGVSISPLTGTLYAFQVRSGIAGTVVANPDFTLHEPDVRTFTDSATRVWTMVQSAVLVDETIRFSGEANSWPMEWDLSGADRWVRLTAAGLSRRLQRGQKPLKSALFRGLSQQEGVVAYWPLEEQRGATFFSSGRANDITTLVPFPVNTVTFAADEESFPSSAPLPTVGAGTISGKVPNYTGQTQQRVVFLISVPAAGWGSERTFADFSTTGTARRWVLSQTSGDVMRVRAYDDDGVEIENTTMSLPIFGQPIGVTLRLSQSGANIDWQVGTFISDAPSELVVGGTVAGETYGRFSQVTLGSTDGMESSAFGHPFIFNGTNNNIWGTIGRSMAGWTRETGAARLARLSEDEGAPAVRIIGNAADTETMGVQDIEVLMDLFREVPTSDLGILTDRPDALGLQYRSRVDLYSQEPVLVLDYSAGIIAEPFRPVDDDQNVANVVTVERDHGSSFTAADTTGPLSSLDPPDGVGKYDISQAVNIETDERLESQAFWRLHLGTIDEARFPEVTLNLRNLRVEPLEADILAVREGDLIRITNLPEWLPGGPYDLLVEAIHEERTSVTHMVTFSCSPGSAWNALILDDSEFGRLDTGGSSTVSDLTAAQTVIGVAMAEGSQPWMRQSVGLVMTGTSSSFASTPDTAALDITGDIEIRAEVHRDSWSDITAVQDLVEKWGAAGTRSYLFRVDTGGFLRLFWSVDGTATMSEVSEVPVPLLTGGRIAVRATLDVSTGDVTFSFSDSIDGTYQQMGAVQTGVATSIFSGSSSLVVGRNDTSTGLDGTVFHARVYNSAGTVVANPDFTAYDGAGSFTDSASLVWTVGSEAQVRPSDPFEIIAGGEVMRVDSIEDNIDNASFEVDGDWTVTGSCTVAQTAFAPSVLEGEFAANITAIGVPVSEFSGVNLDLDTVAPGEWVGIRIPVRPGGVTPSPRARVRIQWRDSAGAQLGVATGTATTLTGFQYTNLSLSGLAPAGTAMTRVSLYLASAGSNVPLANSEASTDAWAVVVGSSQAAVEAGVAGTAGEFPEQFMTVQRAINGVAKTHSPGTAVALAKPIYLSL